MLLAEPADAACGTRRCGVCPDDTTPTAPSPPPPQGHRPGAYVRLRFTGVPCELVTNFDPRFPILVRLEGGVMQCMAAGVQAIGGSYSRGQ